MKTAGNVPVKMARQGGTMDSSGSLAWSRWRWDAIRHFLLTLAVIGHKGCERFALSFTGTGLSMRF